jgi:hypothetical protein
MELPQPDAIRVHRVQLIAVDDVVWGARRIVQLHQRALLLGKPPDGSQHTHNRRDAATSRDKNERHLRAEATRQGKGSARQAGIQERALLHRLVEVARNSAHLHALDSQFPWARRVAIAAERI